MNRLLIFMSHPDCPLATLAVASRHAIRRAPKFAPMRLCPPFFLLSHVPVVRVRGKRSFCPLGRAAA
jgi:hypothetical protein